MYSSSVLPPPYEQQCCLYRSVVWQSWHTATLFSTTKLGMTNQRNAYARPASPPRSSPRPLSAVHRSTTPKHRHPCWRAHLWYVAADRPEIGIERIREENGLQLLLLLLLRRSSAFPLALTLCHVAETESTCVPPVCLSCELPLPGLASQRRRVRRSRLAGNTHHFSSSATWSSLQTTRPK